jgi:hypothetical protein
MNEHDQKRIDQLLKMTLPPMEVGGEPRRNLWPAMLKRLDAPPAAVPWFDWALLAAAAACLAIFPGAIPVLLYHL